MKTANPDKAERENKEKNVMKESLLLPCTSAGKTTSASIAEKSNVWAENKLLEKKSVLDKKLYKNIVKMNTDKLEVVHELSKLKKSASTGALERLNKDRDERHPRTISANSPTVVKSHSKSSLPLTSDRNAAASHLPLESSKTAKSETLIKHADSRAKITITVGGDSSSDEHSDDEKNGKCHTHGHSEDEKCGKHHAHDNKRTFSVTSCTLGRECSHSRSELRKFENATKRYSAALSAKAKYEK